MAEPEKPANVDGLIREGDEAFDRGEIKAALKAWNEAVIAGPLNRRAQILSRVGFARSRRGAKLMKVMRALEDAFPDDTPFVSDGMALWMKLNPFIADVPFLNIAAKHANLLPIANWHWNLQTVVWAVRQAQGLDGDFVELGVFRGHTTLCVAEYVGFADWDRRWLLYDTFSGVPEDQLDAGWSKKNKRAYDGTFSLEEVTGRFAAYPNIEVIKGRVPEILEERCPEKIAFLHMDLNNTAAEIAALEFTLDRLVPGGVIVFDDYGWIASARQHWAEKAWFKKRGLAVMELPTGQGVFIKPPARTRVRRTPGPRP